MKVLHVVEPFSSGIITFVIHLVKGMPDYDHYILHGYRVSEDKVELVRSRFPEKTKFIIWSYAKRSISPLFDLLAMIQLFFTIRKLRPQVVHLHSSKAGFIGRLVCFFLDSKVFYTPNGLSFARKDISTVEKKVYQYLEYFAGRLYGKTICCSRSESQLMASIGVKNICINNGVKIRSLLKKNRADRTITIGCMALLTDQKNPKEFNAIARHFSSRSNVKFLWIGDGLMRNEITSENITITGWLQRDNIEDSLQKIDIYLSCSLWEGLSFSVLEAMNYAKCLIARNCVGNSDLVDHAINGFLYNHPDEAIFFIEFILNNEYCITNMGLNSFKKLKTEFNVNKMVDAYRFEYNK